MRLYINLNKAQVSTTGHSTPDEEQSSIEYESSYSRRYEGEAAGEAYDPDDPKVGGKWGGGESNLDSVKAKLKEREKKNSNTAKSESADILKSFTNRLEADKRHNEPNPTEVKFLTEQLGYSTEDVQKGLAKITGRNRSLFNKWLCDRLAKSASDILPRS